jgi:CheY-like chemotaxis protein/HAMP domain-containing protein
LEKIADKLDVQFSCVRPWKIVRLSSRFSTAHRFPTLLVLSVASALLAAAITSLVFHFGRNGGAVLLLALAALAALPLVWEARRRHSAPWIQLAQTAKSVALFGNYSLRARGPRNGELGTLVDAFNEMLGAIQKRDGDLERHREALEDEICARNAELRALKEELRQANRRVEAACRAQGQALANTGHQIRTRMNGILGMTELALETTLTLEQRDYLLTAKRSAESLLTTLDTVLGVPESALPPPSAGPRHAGASPSEMHVLVVEDHPVSQHLVGMFLARHGHRAHVAANGREALEALAHDSFDAILMDIQMPAMNGFEATRAIRRSERDSGRHIPIVAMTAFAMKGDRERCLESGMDAYVSKPVRPDTLMEALDRACALHAPAWRPLAS